MVSVLLCGCIIVGMESFFVEGVAVPQGSKSARVYGGRAVLTDGFGDKPRVLKAWRRAVFEAAPKLGLDVPVVVELCFVLPRPKSRPRDVFVAVKPDLDKLVRAVLDGLTSTKTEVGLLRDDSRVVRLVAEKRYCGVDGVCGVFVSFGVDVDV